MARLKKEESKCTKPEKWSVICVLAVSENFTSISTIVRLDFRYIYIFILITKWHRYREDIDTIIYNIYTILEHRKTVS